jgi:tripartite-type tricarboxylate transporter receptor subunit TctC
MPITMTARGGSFLLVHPSMPVKSVRELVALARGAPGRIAYASTGRGSAGQLTMEMLAAREKVSFNHVPYKGPSQALTALASGEVSLTTLTPTASGAMVKSGKVRAIAITSPNRTKLFPEVPTTAEAGYPYITYTFWMGLFAPAATGATIVERIHRDTTAIVKRPEFAERYITSTGLDVVANSPAEFADAIRADVAIVGAMVKAADLRPE